MSDSDVQAPAYVAVPEAGQGPGVVVLHAWWGLTPFFRGLCDQLAEAGFVAAAPDLYGDGRTAATVPEAEALAGTLNEDDKLRRAAAAADYLSAHPAVSGPALGAVGFSLGGSAAVSLSALRPEAIAAVVLFYGAGEADYTVARAAYQGHFVPGDEYEGEEWVQAMEQGMRAAGRQVEIHYYPGTRHWFFEANQPSAHSPEAAGLAWQRTLAFLRRHLA